MHETKCLFLLYSKSKTEQDLKNILFPLIPEDTPERMLSDEGGSSDLSLLRPSVSGFGRLGRDRTISLRQKHLQQVC